MDLEEYRTASLQIWDAMAPGWESWRRRQWEVTRRVGEGMVDMLDPQPGEKILELAAGPGDTGFAAAVKVAPEGKLLSTDFSPKMVEVARRQAQNLGLEAIVECRVMDAERMDLIDGTFDGALCRWGYMLMADPVAALRETRRVLRPGGRLAFSVWGGADANPWAAVAGRALMEHTGAPPPDPTAPGIFAMADPKRIEDLLSQAGFELKRAEEVEVVWHFADFDDYWRFINELAGAIATVLRELPEDDQAAIRELAVEGLEPFRADEGYELPGMSRNVLAA